jgi:D-glycero-alpha-D-manno-heptose-7-phosphate kinase
MEQKQQHLRRMRSMVDEGAAILASERPLDEFGLLLDEAWQQKRCLSNLISNSGIDDIYDRAKAAGALGGKLLGAGSSGFMIFYVPPQEQDRFKSEMSGLLNIPFRFEGDGGTIIHYSR